MVRFRLDDLVVVSCKRSAGNGQRRNLDRDGENLGRHGNLKASGWWIGYQGDIFLFHWCRRIIREGTECRKK